MSRNTPISFISDSDLLLIGHMGWTVGETTDNEGLAEGDSQKGFGDGASTQLANVLLSSLCTEVTMTGPYAALLEKLKERNSDIKRSLGGITLGLPSSSSQQPHHGVSLTRPTTVSGQNSTSPSHQQQPLLPSVSPQGASASFFDVVLTVVQSMTASSFTGENKMNEAAKAQAITFTRGAMKAMFDHLMSSQEEVAIPTIIDEATSESLLKHFGPKSIFSLFSSAGPDDMNSLLLDSAALCSALALNTRSLALYMEALIECSQIQLQIRKSRKASKDVSPRTAAVSKSSSPSKLHLSQEMGFEGNKGSSHPVPQPPSMTKYIGISMIDNQLTSRKVTQFRDSLIGNMIKSVLAADPHLFVSPIVSLRVVPLQNRSDGFGGVVSASNSSFHTRGSYSPNSPSNLASNTTESRSQFVGYTIYDDGVLAAHSSKTPFFGPLWAVGAVRHYPLYGETDAVAMSLINGGKLQSSVPISVSFAWKRTKGEAFEPSAPPTPTSAKVPPVPLNPVVLKEAPKVKGPEEEIVLFYNGSSHVGFVGGRGNTGEQQQIDNVANKHPQAASPTTGPSGKPPLPAKIPLPSESKLNRQAATYMNSLPPSATGFDACLITIPSPPPTYFGDGKSQASSAVGSSDNSPNRGADEDSSSASIISSSVTLPSSKGGAIGGPVRVHFALRGTGEVAISLFNTLISTALASATGAATPFIEFIVKDPKRLVRSRKILSACSTKGLEAKLQPSSHLRQSLISTVPVNYFGVSGMKEVFLPTSSTTAAGSLISTSSNLGLVRWGDASPSRVSVSSAPSALFVFQSFQSTLQQARTNGLAGTTVTRQIRIGPSVEECSASATGYSLERRVREDLSVASSLPFPTITTALHFNSSHLDSPSVALATVTSSNGNKEAGLVVGNFNLPRTDDPTDVEGMTIELWALSHLLNVAVPGGNAPADAGQTPAGVSTATHQLFSYGSKHQEELFIEIATQPAGPASGGATSDTAESKRPVYRISGGSRTPRFGVIAATFETNSLEELLQWDGLPLGAASRWVHIALVYSVQKWHLIVNGRSVAEALSSKTFSASVAAAAPVPVAGDENDSDSDSESVRFSHNTFVADEEAIKDSAASSPSTLSSVFAQPTHHHRTHQPNNCTLGKCYAGALAEVRIWAQARSLAEVARDMHRQLCGVDERKLIGYFPLDEGKGLVVSDCSGRGGHSLLVTSAVSVLDSIKDHQKQTSDTASTTGVPAATEILQLPSRSSATTATTGAAVTTTVTTVGGPCWMPLTEALPVAFSKGARYIQDFIPAVWASNSAREVKSAMYRIPTPHNTSGDAPLLFAMAVPVDATRTVVFEYISDVASKGQCPRMVLSSETLFESPTPTSVLLSLVYRSDAPLDSHQSAFDSSAASTPNALGGNEDDSPSKQQHQDSSIKGSSTSYLSAIFYSEKVSNLLLHQTARASNQSQTGAASASRRGSEVFTQGHVEALTAVAPTHTRCLSIVPLRKVSAEEGLLHSLQHKAKVSFFSSEETATSTTFNLWDLLRAMGPCSQMALRTANIWHKGQTSSSLSDKIRLFQKMLPSMLLRPSGRVLERLCLLIRQLRELATTYSCSPDVVANVVETAEAQTLDEIIQCATSCLCLNVMMFGKEMRSRMPSNARGLGALRGLREPPVNLTTAIFGKVDPQSHDFYLDALGADPALAFATPADDAAQLLSRIKGAQSGQLVGEGLSPLRVLEYLAFVPASPSQQVLKANPMATYLHCQLQATLLEESLQLLLTERAALQFVSNRHRGGPQHHSFDEDPTAPEVLLHIAALNYFSDPHRLGSAPIERVLGLSAALLSECLQTTNRVWTSLQVPSSSASASPSSPNLGLSARISDLAVRCIATAQQVLTAHLIAFMATGAPIPPIKAPSTAAQIPMSPTSPAPSATSAFPTAASPPSGPLGGGGGSGSSHPATAMATFIMAVFKASETLIVTLTTALKKTPTNFSSHTALLFEMHRLLSKGIVGALFPILCVLLPTFPLPIIGSVIKPLSNLRDCTMGLLEAAVGVSKRQQQQHINSVPEQDHQRGSQSQRALLQPVADFISSLTLVWTQASCALMLPPNQRQSGAAELLSAATATAELKNHKPLGFPHDRLFRGGMQKKGTARDAALKSLLQGVGVISRIFNEVQSENLGLRGGDQSLLSLERLVMAGLCSALLPTASLVTPTKQEMSALFEHVKHMRPWIVAERQKDPNGFAELMEKKVQLLCSFEPCIVDSRWSFALTSASSTAFSQATASPAASDVNKPNSVRLLEHAKGSASSSPVGAATTSAREAKETARKWRKTFVAWKAFRQLRSLVAILQGNKSLGEAEAAQLVAKYLHDTQFTPARVEAQLLSTSNLGNQKLVGLLGIRQLLQEHKHGRRLGATTLSLLVRAFCGWHYHQWIEGCPNETIARVRGTMFQLVDEVIKEASKAAAAPQQPGGAIPLAAQLTSSNPRARPPNLLQLGQAQQLQQSPNTSWFELALAVCAAPWQAADFAKLPITIIPYLFVDACKDDDTIGRPRLNHNFPPTYCSARIPQDHTAHSVILGPSGLVARGSGLRGCCVMPSLWDPQYHAQQQAADNERSGLTKGPIVPLPNIVYYEITVVDLSANASVGMGIGPSDYNLSRPPGWDPKSFALHDDGVLFSEGSTGRQTSVTISLGDVIGCGYDRAKRSIFFTKNGKEIGVVVELRSDITNVCPLFGFDAKGLIKLNFGAEPFAYPLSAVTSSPAVGSINSKMSAAVQRTVPQRAWDTFKIYAYRVCAAFHTMANLQQSQFDISNEVIENDSAVVQAMHHVLQALDRMIAAASAAGSAERLLASCAVAGHVLSCFPLAPCASTRAASSVSSTTALPHRPPSYLMMLDTTSHVAKLTERLLSVAETFALVPPSTKHGDNFFSPVLTALKGVECALKVLVPSSLANIIGSPLSSTAATSPQQNSSRSHQLSGPIAILSNIADRAFESTASRQAVGWWVVGILRRINCPLPSKNSQSAVEELDSDADEGAKADRSEWGHPWAHEVHTLITKRLDESASRLTAGQSSRKKELSLLLLPLAILGAGSSPIPLPGDEVLRRPKMYQCGQVLSYLLEDEVVTIISSEAEDATSTMIGFDYNGNIGGPTSVKHLMSTARVRVATIQSVDGGFGSSMAHTPASTADVVTHSTIDKANLAERRRLLTTEPPGSATCLNIARCPLHVEQITKVISVANKMWGSMNQTGVTGVSVSVTTRLPIPTSGEPRGSIGSPTPQLASPDSAMPQVGSATPTPALDSLLNARLLQSLWVSLQALHTFRTHSDARRDTTLIDSSLQEKVSATVSALMSSVCPSPPLLVQLASTFCQTPPEKPLLTLMEDNAIAHAVFLELTSAAASASTMAAQQSQSTNPISPYQPFPRRQSSSAASNFSGSRLSGTNAVQSPLVISSLLSNNPQSSSPTAPANALSTTIPPSPLRSDTNTNEATAGQEASPLSPPSHQLPVDDATRVRMAQELATRGFPYEVCSAALEATGYVYSAALQWIMSQSDNGALGSHNGVGLMGAGAFDFGYEEGGVDDDEDGSHLGEEEEDEEGLEEGEDGDEGNLDDDAAHEEVEEAEEMEHEEDDEEHEGDGDDGMSTASASTQSSMVYDGFSLKGGSYITVAADTTLGPQFTICLWLKCDTIDADQDVFCEVKNPNLEDSANENSKVTLRFSIQGSVARFGSWDPTHPEVGVFSKKPEPVSPTTTSGPNSTPSSRLVPHFLSREVCEVPIGTAELGRWTHYTCVQNGPELSMFKNGQLKATATANASCNLLSSPFCLGGCPLFPERTFTGDMKGIRVYDNPLAKSAIAALQGVGASTLATSQQNSEESLAINFRCDEGKFPLHNAAVSASAIACRVDLVGEMKWSSATEGLPVDSAVTLPEIDFTTHGDDEAPYIIDATSLDATPSVLYRQLKKAPLTSVASKLLATSQELSAYFASRIVLSGLLFAKEFTPHSTSDTTTTTATGQPSTLLAPLIQSFQAKQQIRPLVRAIVHSNDIHLVALLQQVIFEILASPDETKPSTVRAAQDVISELVDQCNKPQSIESYESSHPCRALNDPPREVSFPKQRFYDIFFDPRGANGNVLATFYSDHSLTNIVAQHSGYSFRLKAPKFIFDVRTDGVPVPLWGYKLSVVYNSHSQLIAARLLRLFISEVTNRAATTQGNHIGSHSVNVSPSPSPAKPGHQSLQSNHISPLAASLFNATTINSLISACRINVGKARRIISSNIVKLLKYPKMFLTISQADQLAALSLSTKEKHSLLQTSQPQLPDFTPLNEIRKQLDKQFRRELGLSIHSRFVQCMVRLMVAVRDASLIWSEVGAPIPSLTPTLTPAKTAPLYKIPVLPPPAVTSNDNDHPSKNLPTSAGQVPPFGGSSTPPDQLLDSAVANDEAEGEETVANEEARFQEHRSIQRSLYADRITDGHERLEVQRRLLPERLRVEPNVDKTTSVWCEQAGAAVSANVAVGGGLWYFEVKIISSGDVAIGVAAVGAESRLQLWGLNGKFGLISTPGSQTSASPTRLWKSKDIVGVIIDANRKQLRYQVNGVDLPVVVDYGTGGATNDGAQQQQRRGGDNDEGTSHHHRAAGSEFSPIRSPLPVGTPTTGANSRLPPLFPNLQGGRGGRGRGGNQHGGGSIGSSSLDSTDVDEEDDDYDYVPFSSGPRQGGGGGAASADYRTSYNVDNPFRRLLLANNGTLGTGGNTLSGTSANSGRQTTSAAIDAIMESIFSSSLLHRSTVGGVTGQGTGTRSGGGLNSLAPRTTNVGGARSLTAGLGSNSNNDVMPLAPPLMVGFNGGISTSQTNQQQRRAQPGVDWSLLDGVGSGHGGIRSLVELPWGGVAGRSPMPGVGGGRAIGGGAGLGTQGGRGSYMPLSSFFEGLTSSPSRQPETSSLFRIPHGSTDASEGSEGAVGFTPWMVLGSDECVIINFGSRHFDFEVPHGALPLDPTNLGVGSLIPFNQLRAFDDVAAAFATSAASPPFFSESNDPSDAPTNREGPTHVSLVGPQEMLSSLTELRNTSLTFATAKTDCRVSNGGRWYYETLLTTQGLMQIGWCDSDAVWNSPSALSKGVGDTETSFGIDLFRRVLWHGGSSTQLDATRRWAAGDVIGCALDLNSKEALFTLNGRPIAQISVRSSLALSPAISLRSGNGCIVNFGTNPLRFKPEGYSALGAPDTWVERIDTYYSTLTTASCARRLLRLERSGIPQNATSNDSSPVDVTVGSGPTTNIMATPVKQPTSLMGSPSPSLSHPSPSSVVHTADHTVPLKVYSAFVAAIDEFCQEAGKEEPQLSVEAAIAAAKEKVPSLKHFNCAKIFSELRYFSRIGKVAIPLLPFEKKAFDSSSRLLSLTRELLFFQTRDQLFTQMLKETNCRAEHFRLTINRNHPKAAAFRNATSTGASTSKLPRPSLSTTVFGQTVMLLGEQHPRIFKTSKRFWTTSFAGEGAEDAGGPFRAHINDICSELMSNALPLFVPTANNVHNLGDYREAFVPAAGAVDLKNASLFRFVGKLMGGCIRNGEPMGVYFPPILWKKLANVGPITLADIAGMDKVCVQCVNEFATMRTQYGDEMAEELFNDTFATEMFVTRLSDGTMFDLIPNGSTTPVTFDKCEAYAKAIAEARMAEFDKQVGWMREGLLSVIPEMCLTLLAPHELELKVCGKPDYSVKELQEGATFEGLTAEDKRVQYMWSALESATTKQRRLFLKFVSGRERMPVKLRVLPLVTTQNPDTLLPRAATCFFAIELPEYSCAEVMKKKLIYSIENCAEIDTDFRARDVDIDDGPQLHIGSEERTEEDVANTAQE